MMRLAIFAALLSLAMAAAAQDAPAIGSRVWRRPDLSAESACAERDGLSLCVLPPGAPRGLFRTRREKAGNITRFARLAGMFMGRVDAADWGPLKVRFKLEIL